MQRSRLIPRSRILFVLDSIGVAQKFRDYFETRHGYSNRREFYGVDVETQGNKAIEICSEKYPAIVVVDVDSPGLNVYEFVKTVCAVVQYNSFLFIGDLEPPIAKIVDFSPFARVDYIAKPYTIEDVEKKIQLLNRYHKDPHLADPTTRLPAGQAIDDQLQSMLSRRDWALVCARIEGIDSLESFVLQDSIIRSVAQLIDEIIIEYGVDNDFIGHLGGGEFIIVVQVATSNVLTQELRARFTKKILELYLAQDRMVSTLTFAIMILDGTKHSYSNAREIVEHIGKITSTGL